jgi:hypothetical protein
VQAGALRNGNVGFVQFMGRKNTGCIDPVRKLQEFAEMTFYIIDSKPANVIILAEAANPLGVSDIGKSFIEKSRHERDYSEVGAIVVEHAMQMPERIGYVAGSMFEHMAVKNEVELLRRPVIEVAQIDRDAIGCPRILIGV